MNQLGFTIGTNMSLHAKVASIVFQDLMHLGIARLVNMFDGTRRSDNTGIDDGASIHFLSVLFEGLIEDVL